MKSNEFLKTVLAKYGIDTNSADVQTFIGNTSLASIEVPDTISSLTARELYTRESALQNPEIRKTLRAEALNGVDTYAEELATKHSFTPEEIAEIKSEAKTTRKLELMAEKIKTKTEALHKASGAGKEALQKEVEVANAKLVKMAADHGMALSQEKANRKSDKINWQLDSIYGGLEYSLPTDKGISIVAAKSVLSNFLNEKGLTFDETEKGLVLMTKEGTAYFDPANNTPPKADDFIKKVLLENKMLKVSTGLGTGKQGQQRQQQQQNNNQGGEMSAAERFRERALGHLNEEIQNHPTPGL